MKQLELAIEFLKKRSFSTVQSEDKLMQQLSSVLQTSEVIAVLEMVKNGDFIDFVKVYDDNDQLNKLYFIDTDDNKPYKLKYHLESAKEIGLKEIELVEALPDADNDFVYCTSADEVYEVASECNNCAAYVPVSDTDKTCAHKGQLMKHGDVVKFTVS